MTKESSVVSLDEFRKIAELVKTLLEEGSMEIDFSPYATGWKARGVDLDKALSTYGLSEESFKNGFKEFLKLLRRILEDDEWKFIDAFPEEEKETIREKCKLIDSMLSERVKERFIFHTRSKNLVFDDIDWDILEYKGKDGETSIRSILIQFELRDPTVPPSCPPMSNKVMIFECTKHDIEYILKELERAKRRFEHV